MVLKEGVHDRLLQDIDYISTQTRVPVTMIKHSAADYISENQSAYIRGFRKLRVVEKGGSADMTGKQQHPPEQAMMAMAAVLIRNFIDARVYPLQTVLDEKVDTLSPTVLFVPNFQNSFIGKPLASHQIQRLYSILMDRLVHEKVTVLYVESVEQMVLQYGTAVGEFIQNNYLYLPD